jgi:hypothetical protein
MKNMKMKVLLAATLLAWGTTASADLIFNLGSGNSAIAGFPGPYAQVDVHWVDSTHATITFTSDIVGGNIYLFGDGGSVAVNVNATSWTLGAITGTGPSGAGFGPPGPYSDGGAGNEDGWGSFNQTINSFDGYTNSSNSITFGLTDVSGTWASENNVLTANKGGSLAAAHIFVAANPPVLAAGALATGFAAGNSGGPPPQQVPEPGMLALLGMGLLSLTGMRRRRS